jgi:pimeloyl-ACP methyl ester carboxylesterase
VSDPSHHGVLVARTPAVTFDSAGEKLLGVLHLPAGPGPHPIVVLLHGFPGNERNFDLAQVFRRAGYAALVFHYRGSWGVGGSWSWAHVLEDAARVLAGVRDQVFVAAHQVDTTRLALVGHSLGGFAALMTAAADPSVSAVAAIASFDFGAVAAQFEQDSASQQAYVAAFDDELLALAGTSGDALVAEMRAAGQAWSLARLAPRLSDRPILLVGCSRDTVTPLAVHHNPIIKAYRALGVSRLEHHVFPTDHVLSDHRVALARTVLAFLDRNVR